MGTGSAINIKSSKTSGESPLLLHSCVAKYLPFESMKNKYVNFPGI